MKAANKSVIGRQQGIVIIGAGMAAYLLLAEIRRLDSEVACTLITQDNGDYYIKTKLSNLFQNQAPLSSTIQGTAETMAEKYNASVVTHTQITGLDPEKKQLTSAKGQVFSYDACVLAVGVSPKQSMSSAQALNVVSVNHQDDYKQFEQLCRDVSSVGVLGSGLVGMEFIDDCLSLGKNVVCLSKDPLPLNGHCPKPVAQALKDKMLERGVDWYQLTDAQLHQLQDNPQSVLESLGIQDISLWLSATGFTADCPWLASLGVVSSSGVMVDAYGQVALPQVYAIGDCACGPEGPRRYIPAIRSQARALAQTLLGQPTMIEVVPSPVHVKLPNHPLIVMMPEPSMDGTWIRWHDPNHPSLMAFWFEEKATGLCRGFVLFGKQAPMSRAYWMDRLNKVQQVESD